jgi:CheY-like chemotaxis protein/catechol 2,3-dioxygenase-like lactoylglutathione lyase family enzyme
MPAPPPRLDGLRILVVEDEFLVSIALEDDLREAGATVVGPFNDLESGRDGAAREPFDLAVLDVNLNGTMIYPLADAIMASALPLMFLSGYGGADMPQRFAALPRLAKPYDLRRLIDTIARLAPSKESAMLKDRPATAMIPAKDFARARGWYADKLGLTPSEEFPDGGGAVYVLGGGLRAFLYPTEYAGTAQHTLLSFDSPDLAADMQALRAKGVSFLDYDLPGLKTVDGVATFGPVKNAWARDSEGNILGFVQGM